MIRPALLQDMPTLLGLARGMHREAPAYQDWPYDEAKVEALLGSLIAGHGCLLVAELADGSVVGGIAGICVPHWFSQAKVATDLALFIAPARRNGTTAMRLVEGFMTWAELVGARRVQLGVTTGVHPEATGRLFEACGLVPSGQLFAKDF